MLLGLLVFQLASLACSLSICLAEWWVRSSFEASDPLLPLNPSLFCYEMFPFSVKGFHSRARSLAAVVYEYSLSVNKKSERIFQNNDVVCRVMYTHQRIEGNRSSVGHVFYTHAHHVQKRQSTISISQLKQPPQSRSDSFLYCNEIMSDSHGLLRLGRPSLM